MMKILGRATTGAPENGHRAAGPARENAIRLGFWSAIITAIVAAAHLAIGIMTPARSGPFARPEDIIPTTLSPSK